MPFKIIRNDITKMKADAIVNTANPDPIFSRGTDGALYRAAGEEQLLAERKKIGRIPVGEAAVTPAFKLEARYIIHTVGPVWQGGGCGEADAVRFCYRNSLRLAREKGCESIAFPLIATGTYGFPKEEALRIALSEISSFLAAEDMMVWLVVFDSEAFGVSEKIFSDIDSYIDNHYVEERSVEEYGIPCAGAVSNIQEMRELGGGIESLPGTNTVFRNPQKADKETRGGRGNAAMGLLELLPKPMSLKGRSVSRKTHLAEPPAFPSKPKKAEDVQFFVEPPIAASIPNAQLDKLPQARRFPPFPQRQKVQERSLEDVMAQLGETFQQRLFRLIDERGLTDVEVYKKANIDRKLFSKIRCNADYRPKKITAVALAVSLELSLDETKDLLSRAEMALSPSSKFDLIITYFMEREIYDIYTINVALFQHGQPLLGA